MRLCMSTRINEALVSPARLDALLRLGLLDTPPEESFDRLTRLAARLLSAPVALVSLVDDHRQFFKSAFGLPQPWATVRETPLSHSFCQHVVSEGKPLIVEDARAHPLVCGNPAVTDLNHTYPLASGPSNSAQLYGLPATTRSWRHDTA